MCKLYVLESTIAELFGQVLQKKQLTLADRCVLMMAISSNSLCPDEEVLINRLLYAVRRGLLKVVDEL